MSKSSTIATALALALLAPVTAWAEDVGEARIYLDADANVLGEVTDSVTLRPLLRTEQRFRVDGLHRFEEVRFDSDQVRPNMNDLRAGFDLVASSWLKIRDFHNLELNRRDRTEWARTHGGGLMFLARL